MDSFLALPLDVRRLIGYTFFNWNWVLIPELETRISETFVRANYIDALLFCPFMYRLKAFLFKLRTESPDLRILYEGGLLAGELEGIEVFDLARELRNVLDYNLTFITSD